MDMNVRKNVVKVLKTSLKRFNIKGKISSAVDKAYAALDRYHHDITAKADEIIRQARSENRKIIVLAGRPYHIDKEINHGIHKLVTSLGMAVITEDSVAHLAHTPQLGVLNQWTYHSRLYRAAEYVTTQPDMQLIQLVSFGCGIDAVTGDEVRNILESKGKLYTQLKIDEINNLGAARIRLRSLVAAMDALNKG
jgi:predicted nucleotide-binding protein (sugar kinase/HSP70/actin superfamily)